MVLVIVFKPVLINHFLWLLFIMKIFQKHGVTLYGDIEFTSKAELYCESPVNLRSITLGIRTTIGAGTYISGPAIIRGLESIGRFCSLGNNILIGPGNHPTNWLSSSPFQYNAIYMDHPEFRQFGITGKTFDSPSPVSVGDDVWIGSNVTILSGVRVGTGAIVGAGSVVTKDVPPYAICVGVPAKIIRYRFTQDIIKQLLDLQWWNYDIRGMEKVSFDDVPKAIDEIKYLVKTNSLIKREVKVVKITKEMLVDM